MNRSDHLPLAAEQRARRNYIWGLLLSLVLTLVPFALVHWQIGSRPALFAAIAGAALVQMAVQLQFFLHIGRQHKRDELLLLLFSALLLFIMVAGTLWIMASLAQRMMP